MQRLRRYYTFLNTEHQFCPCDISDAAICKDLGRYCTFLNIQHQFCPCDILDEQYAKTVFVFTMSIIKEMALVTKMASLAYSCHLMSKSKNRPWRHTSLLRRIMSM